MAVAVTLWGVAALLGIAVLGVVTQRLAIGSRLIYCACLLVCLAILFAACSELLVGAGHVQSLQLPVGLPWIGARFSIDALAAFFLAVVNLGAAAASLYALGYGEHEKTPGRVLPFYPAFLAGMNLVILAADAFSFLFAWEFMSLTSWLLVMTYHHDPDNRRAGYIYIVMASFGTLALLLAFGLLAGPGWKLRVRRYARRGGRRLAPRTGARARSVGSRLQGRARAAARVAAARPPGRAEPCLGIDERRHDQGRDLRLHSHRIRSAGAAGVVVGQRGVGARQRHGRARRAHAVMQRDLKRLLAYSTVENVGIIFVGLGLALAFKANGMTAAAALAFTAALLHVLNHSLFKSLLFFGAGAVLGATGARDIEKLGGLIHRMPWTAFVFLGGCVAISALPPLNGFVSEWLVFQAVLLSPDLPEWGLKLLVPAAGAMLALGAALSAACFVRAYGITFLGRPRSVAAADALETDAFSLAAMSILLCLCLLAGILPGFVIDAVAPVAQDLVGQRMPAASRAPLVLDRAGGREPELLQRAARLRLHRDFGNACRRGHSSFRLARRPPRPGLGLRLSRSETGDPVHGRQLRAAAAPRVRRGLPARASALRCRRRAMGGQRASKSGCATSSGTLIYAPIEGWVAFASERMNTLQFLTIRQYLSLVFGALVGAAARGGGMDLILSLAVQGVQMLLVLILAPLAAGVHPQGEGAAVAPPRASRPPALSGSAAADPQGGRARRERVVALSQRPLLDLRCDVGRRRAGPDLRHGTGVQLGGGPDRDHGAARLREVLPRPRRHGRRHELRRHRLEPRDDVRLARRAGHDHDRVHRRPRRGLHTAVGGRRFHARACHLASLARAGARRAHHSRAGRERAHSRRQPGHAPGAHDGARGDGARVLGPSPGCARARRRAQIAALYLPHRLHLFPVGAGAAGQRRRGAMRSAPPATRASFWSEGSCSRSSRPRSPRCASFACRNFLGVALMLGLLGTLLLFVSRSF